MKNSLILLINKEKLLSHTVEKRFEKIFSDKIGIINAILKRNELRKYGLYIYQSLSIHTMSLFKLNKQISSGGLGISFDKRKAFLSCLSESIERYSVSYFNEDKSILTYWKNLPKRMRINNFYLYKKAQYEKLPFSNPKKEKIYWTKIKDVNSKEEKYWPASLIFQPFRYKSVAETTSTGLACNRSLKKAILNGTLEILERDAIMLNYLQRLNPVEIDYHTINDSNKKFIIKIIKDYKLKIYRLYNELNIPVYLTIVWKGNKKAIYGIGASANISSEKAISKALTEALFSAFYSKKIMFLRKNKKEQIKSLYEHFLYYQKENFSKLLFYSDIVNYNPEKLSVKEFWSRIKKSKNKVYFIDVTTEDLKRTGNKIVRVVMPGMVDLNKNYKYLRLDARRFWDFPKKLKLNYNRHLSTLPHPFP